MANEILIGIDTNILVRYIVQDDIIQSQLATEFLENLSNEKQGFISTIVLTELIWVLRKIYKQTRLQVADIIEELIMVNNLNFENKIHVINALSIYKNVASDFSDLLISSVNHSIGRDYTITFDINASNKANMKLLTN